MKLYSIEAGNYKIDGGAAFGTVPKSIWEKLYKADKDNLIVISQRCLLIEDAEHIILVDTGMGNKQSEKFYSYQHLLDDYDLIHSIEQTGYSPDKITDVIFTHLHYDHCGGALLKNDSGYVTVFNNAIHWCSRVQWEWAQKPNKREQAAYFQENYMPLYKSGQLKFIEKEGNFTNNVYLKLFNGHTWGQIIPFIKYKNYVVVYTSDFIPSSAHIPIHYIASFDIQPLISMQEKEAFLEEALSNNYILFFEHDSCVECCTLKMTPKGIRVDKLFKISDLY